jgi:CheY-like chemotaxis protein
VEYYLEDSRATPRVKQYTLEQVHELDARSQPAAAESTETPAPSPAATEPPPKPRVLVVDSAAETRDGIKASLADDFQVVTANNGAQAIERIIMFRPDLLVVEAQLPGMSGFELCTSVRRNKAYSTTPIVFLSCKASDRERRMVEQAGGTDVVKKPVDPEALRRKLLAYTQAPGFAVRPKKMAVEVSFPGGSGISDDAQGAALVTPA